jgi:primosomal protein N''
VRANMKDEKSDELNEHKYTVEIEKLQKELDDFQKEWEKDKKKGLQDIEKIEKKIDQKD